jgi:hypothetical protein
MHPMMMAEIAADQIRNMQADAARDQQARLARRGRRAGHRVSALRHGASRTAARELSGHHA